MHVAPDPDSTRSTRAMKIVEVFTRLSEMLFQADLNDAAPAWTYMLTASAGL
jgi:hypothetical protein